jgi:hypothetical protein
MALGSGRSLHVRIAEGLYFVLKSLWWSLIVYWKQGSPEHTHQNLEKGFPALQLHP